MSTTGRLTGLAGLVTAALFATHPADAHWCNNIWSAPARMVVKPETSTVVISGSNAATLRVYVRNNFPYKLVNVEMQGSASGYTVQVTAGNPQAIYPGQEVPFVFSIRSSGGSGGSVPVTNLNLQVRFRSASSPYGWLAGSDCRVDPNASDSLLAQRAVYGNGNGGNCGPNQSASLAAATLFDRNQGAALPGGEPTFGRSGIRQAAHYFGYRFCYAGNGTWRNPGQDCPGAVAEGAAWDNTDQFGQNCMRAGSELAIRKSRLNQGDLDFARAAAVNALKPGNGSNTLKGSAPHKCMAAVAGAHLWVGASSTDPFTTALNDANNAVPPACRSAGMHVLTGAALTGDCPGTQPHTQAACAAAQGLRGNDGPVRSVLMPGATDGESNGYNGLYFAYMLSLVAGVRQAASGGVSFYPDSGGTAPRDSGVTPPRDSGVTPPRDTGVARDRGTTPPRDGAAPPQDAAPPLRTDAYFIQTEAGPVQLGDGFPRSEAGVPLVDAQFVTPTLDGGAPGKNGREQLRGGCAVTPDTLAPPGLLLALLLLGLLRLRRLND